MVKLKRIYIRNFETVKEATIEFPDSGFCLLRGLAGSGKTLLGEAITRTLLGVRGRFKGTGLGAYSSDLTGNTNTLVKLECELNGSPLIVWNGYRCHELSDKGEGLRYHYNGTMVERGKISETRGELSALLRLPANLASFTVNVDGEKIRFGGMSEEDLVDLFVTATTRLTWGSAKAKVDNLLRQTRKEQQETKGSWQSVQESVTRWQDQISDLTEQLKEEQVRHKAETKDHLARIQEATQTLKESENSKDELEKIRKGYAKDVQRLDDEKAKQLAEWELQLSRVKSKWEQKNRELFPITEKKATAEADHRAVVKELRGLQEPDTCPTCGKAWDKKHSEKLLTEAKVRLKKLDQEAEKWKKEADSVSAELDDLKDQSETLEDQIDSSPLSEKIKKINDQDYAASVSLTKLAKTIKEQTAALELAKQPISNEALISLRAQLTQGEKQLVQLRKDQGPLKDKLSELTKSVVVLEYWQKAFGPTGLPNFAMGQSIGYVNHVSNYLSDLMTGGSLGLSFSTTKVLANSEERPSLQIKVTNKVGSSSFEGSSKGENSVSNLIIAETLNELSQSWKKIGFRWLDECALNQSDQTRHTFYQHIRKQTAERGLLIFVVDHDREVENYADKILIVEKSLTGFTSYRWS